MNSETDSPNWVTVLLRRLSVRGPPRMSDAGVRLEELGQVELPPIDELSQFGHLADLLEGKDLILLVAIDRKTGRVISTILQP